MNFSKLPKLPSHFGQPVHTDFSQAELRETQGAPGVENAQGFESGAAYQSDAWLTSTENLPFNEMIESRSLPTADGVQPSDIGTGLQANTGVQARQYPPPGTGLNYYR